MGKHTTTASKKKKPMTYEELMKRRYCFKKKRGGTTLSIPTHIIEKLGIKDGEKPGDWQAILHSGEEKTLKIRIIRGESLYDD